MKNLFPIIGIMAALIFFTGSPASAQLTWGSGGAGGTGTWDNSTADWYNGTSNVAWTIGDTGTFTGTSGTVTISGTQIASALVFGTTSGTYTLNGGALGVGFGPAGLTVETDHDAVINSNIVDLSSTGTFTKTGANTLTLGGNNTNTFTSLAINAGTLAYNTSGFNITTYSLGQGTITLGVVGTSSGTLAYTPSGTLNFVYVTPNVTVQGNGNDTITVSGTGQQNTIILTGTVSINHTTLTLFSLTSSAGSIDISGPIIATADSVLNVKTAVSLSNSNNTIQTINITSTNTYLDPNDYTGGIYLLVSNALSSTATVNMNQGFLGLGLGSGAPVSVTVASLNGNGLVFGNSGYGTGNLTINNSSADTFSGGLGDPAPFNNFSLTKTGTGTLFLTGVGYNTYSGGTIINAGAIVIGKGTTTSSGTISGGGLGIGLITINDGATLSDSGTAVTLANSLAVSGTVTFASTGTGSFIFDGSALNTPSTFQITGDTNLVANENVAIADSLSNSGNFNLIKTGSGTLSLTGTNSSGGTGNTTIAAGTLLFANGGGNLGSGTINLASGTSLQYTGSNSGTLNQNITVSSGTATLGNVGSGGILTLTGTLSANGSTLNITGTSTLAQRLVIAGPIVGASANSNVNFMGLAIIGLTSADSYSGSTLISGGASLLMGVDNALPSGTVLTLGTGGGVLDLLGHNETVSGLTSTVASDRIESSNGSATTPASGSSTSAATGNLTVNIATGNDIFAGTLGTNILLGNLNNFSLTKSGTGTLALTHTTGNLYNGGTFVTSGTLIVGNNGGSATGTGTISVSSGATLTGSGKITSTNITINGYVQPGTGGTDTTGSLTLTSTSTAILNSATLTFNLSTTTLGQSNELVMAATPSVLFTTSTLAFNLVGGTAIADGTQYTLLTSSVGGSGVGGSIFGGDISVSGSVIMGLNTVINTPGYANSYLMLVADGSGYDIDLITGASPVPEPGTWALLLGGFMLLVACHRKARVTKARD